MSNRTASQLATIRGPVKGSQAGTNATRRGDATRKQVRGDGSSAEETCTAQSLRQRGQFLLKWPLFTPFDNPSPVRRTSHVADEQRLKPREISVL